jgi:putative transposase
MAISLKGVQYPKSVILFAACFYIRYAVSYRDLEEIMAERGVEVDHATLNRWVVRFAPQVADQVQARKRPTASSWRMDETCIKVRGQWTYLYRAVDRDCKILDFRLSEKRDEEVATAFFAKVIETNGWPETVVIDKSGANLAGLQNMNLLLIMHSWYILIEILQVKYLNNIIEQDHRFIKKLTRPMLGFKALQSGQATIAWIEAAHMIRKGQLANDNRTLFELVAELVG